MPELLYLDTARLGQMSPRACRASVDFARFASEQGASLYLTEFLRHGFQSLPSGIADNYAGIAEWSGVAPLKDASRRLSHSHQNAEVLLASRSASLMKLAARLLVRPCRNILLTDLTWPSYGRILRQALPHSACTTTTVKVRRRILQRRLDHRELVDELATVFVEQNCDGLFLPLVDNLGVQLPVNRIVERIRADCELRFVVIDGAQAIQHVPLQLEADYCDFLIAGSHKWLRAFTPMGIGLFGHPRSADYIRDALARWLSQGLLDDPLLQFTNELQSGRNKAYGETVSVSPLITANGAIMDALSQPGGDDSAVASNRIFIREVANDNWDALLPCDEFASRIMLLRAKRERDRRVPPDELRRRFVNSGIALSTYRGGMVRLSLPDSRFDADQQHTIQTALRR